MSNFQHQVTAFYSLEQSRRKSWCECLELNDLEESVVFVRFPKESQIGQISMPHFSVDKTIHNQTRDKYQFRSYLALQNFAEAAWEKKTATQMMKNKTYKWENVFHFSY